MFANSLDEVHALGALDAVGVVDQVGDGGAAATAVWAVWAAVEQLGEGGEVVGRAGREAGRRRQQAQNVVLGRRERGDVQGRTKPWKAGLETLTGNIEFP